MIVVLLAEVIAPALAAVPPAHRIMLGGTAGEYRVLRLERGRKYYIMFSVDYYYGSSGYDIAKLVIMDSGGQVLAASFKKTPGETLEQAIGAAVGFVAAAAEAYFHITPSYSGLVDAAEKLVHSLNSLEQLGVVSLSRAETLDVYISKYVETKKGSLQGALEIVCGVNGACYAIGVNGRQRIGDRLYILTAPVKAPDGSTLEVHLSIDTGYKASLFLLAAAIVAAVVFGAFVIMVLAGRRSRGEMQLGAVLGALMIVAGVVLAAGGLLLAHHSSTTTPPPASTTTLPDTVTANPRTVTYTETVTRKTSFEKTFTVTVPQCEGSQGYIVVNVEDKDGSLVASVYGSCGPARPMSGGDTAVALLCVTIDGEDEGCVYVYTLPGTQYIPAESGSHTVKIRLFDLR